MYNNNLAILHRLLEGYEGSFNVYRDIESLDFVAQAHFHSKTEKYVLTKSAKLWGVETNEYVFFANAENLSVKDWSHICDKTIEEGLKLVKPNSEHMCSYITLVLITDNVDGDCIKKIKKASFSKMYKFSLQGWATLHTAVIIPTKKTIITNYAGKALCKQLARYL